MSGENNHVFHTSALDGAQPEQAARPPYAWSVFAAQLWTLALFAGMSLIAIAARLSFQGDSGDRLGTLVMPALAGGILVAIAWRNIARLLHRAQRKRAQPEGASRVADHRTRTIASARPTPAHATITGMTPTL